MIDLLTKVYKSNGWIRRVGESRTKRVKEFYDLEIDYKNNMYRATERV